MESSKKEILGMSVSARAQGFAERTCKKENERRLSTGFARLDEVLHGGLHSGLYILGGSNAVGKTTFMLQMADAIARCEPQDVKDSRIMPKEQDGERRCVLFYSLEMGADELMARSVSRISRLKTVNNNEANALEYADILDGFRDDRFTITADKACAFATFNSCLKEHEKDGNYELINDSVAGTTIDAILADIKDFIGKGLKPVVFIDHLQIIPHNGIVGDKIAVTKSIVALKRAAREFNVPIIVASNRGDYKLNSGLWEIEYAADVLLDLQWDYTLSLERIGYVILRVLKNRRGAAGQNIKFRFEEPFACFFED